MAQTSPYLIPSLIGGISEQSPQDRPSSTCEYQQNCLNDPLNGCSARPGGVVVGSVAYSMSDPFIHDIRRSQDEHYKVMIEGGVMIIVNIIDGEVAEQTDPEVVEDYLTHTGPARLAFTAVTVEDTTFIINKQRTVAMDSALSDVRPNKAMFYFKAGSYSTKYRAAIKTDAGTLWAEYVTPDNTDPENAKFITTRSLAEGLKEAFLIEQAAVAPAYNGFTFTKDASTVIVERSSSTPFEIDTEDGIGDTQLIGVTEWVSKFENLPGRAPHNYVVGVRGSKADQKDDYWLAYKGGGTTGYWQEIVKPATPTRLDEDTMPHLLLNTAKGAFTCSKGTWNTRISGDGVLSAKDPTFVGRKINSAGFISGRLALVTEGTFMLSRARNAYCFFPDTAQTRLDTDPIGFEIANGKSTIITGTVAASGRLHFWGDRNQMILDSGDQPLTEEFTDCLPAATYEYDGNCQPEALGKSSVIFGTGVGNGVALKEVVYRSSVPIGEISLNDHCPKFINGALREIAIGDAAGVLAILTSEPNTAYIYQWLNQGDQRVQTAWNKWTFPLSKRVVSAAVRGKALYLLFDIGPKLVVERFDIDSTDLSVRDIRLDHRITQQGATYDDGVATLTLPYPVTLSHRSRFKVIRNEDDGTGTYGAEELDFTFNGSNQIIVTLPPDAPTSKFWFGEVPAAARLTMSQLYVQTKGGTMLPDKNLIDKLKVSHTDTSEYRVEVRDPTTDTLVVDEGFDSRQAFTTTPNNKLSKSRSGEKTFPVERKAHEVEITLVNDTIYPSRWVQAEYHFAATR